jgi:hypothetical protein
MEEMRALLPGVYRACVAAIGLFLVLALLAAVAATAQPLMLVVTAFFVVMAGSVRVGVWAWDKTTTPSVRNRLEQARREREASRQPREPSGQPREPDA